jgi:DNA-binding Xre family transcriptional regulator
MFYFNILNLALYPKWNFLEMIFALHCIQKGYKQEGILMMLTKDQLLLLRRKKGELNLTLSELSHQIGISRTTGRKIVMGKVSNFHNKTIEKVNDWLIKQNL